MEVEKEIECENCGASYRVLYEDDKTDYLSPDTCPFCGESVNSYDEDDEEDFWDEEDDDDLLD